VRAIGDEGVALFESVEAKISRRTGEDTPGAVDVAPCSDPLLVCAMPASDVATNGFLARTNRRSRRHLSTGSGSDDG